MPNLRFAVLLMSALIIAAFFMPWVKGEGSIVRPVDEASKPLQEKDKTGLTKAVTQSAKGVVDKTTEKVFSIQLKQALSGFQIPLSKDKVVRRMSAKRDLVYIVPLTALLCAFLSVTAKQRLKYIRGVFFTALGMFILLSLVIARLQKTILFAKIRPCYGLFIIQFAFLAIVVIAFLEAIRLDE